jgi:endonuclease YncB( thermonuclease family)
MKHLLHSIAVSTLVMVSSVCAQEQNPDAVQNPIFDIPNAVEFLTGDSWNQGGTVVRLFGVQSCIRGTTITNAKGEEIDCGQVSMTYLASFMARAPTRCQGIAETATPPQYLVVCKSEVQGQSLDLGNTLILEGFAFASEDMSGAPVNEQYAISEDEAKTAGKGLWKFPFPHPNAVMRTAIEKTTSKGSP